MLAAAGLSLLGAVAAVAIGRRRAAVGEPAEATTEAHGQHVVSEVAVIADASA
jgi:hypothetical protein